MQKLVFLFNPRLPEAEPFGRDLARHVNALGVQSVVASVWDEEAVRTCAADVDFAVTLGGDGTVLRAARLVAPLGIPLVGVNLGQLGFLTELGRREAAQKLPRFLERSYWVEERIMLSARIERQAKPSHGRARVENYLAMNEVVAGRAALARAVHVGIGIDGVHLTQYVADGVIVSTPTGSTAYSLAAGGPVLHPQMQNVILTPILPHLASAYPLVFPQGAIVRVEVTTGHQASLTVDGQIETPLYNGDLVEVSAAVQRARFLRAQAPSYFYEMLANRLRREARHDLPESSAEAPSDRTGDTTAGSFTGPREER